MAVFSRLFLVAMFLMFFTLSARASIPSHQWSQHFGGTVTDWGYGVAVDGSDNVIVAGTFNGTVNFGGGNLVSSGATDIFVAKYDNAGVHQWSQRFGGTGAEFCYGLTIDASNNAIVTGYFSGMADFGGTNLVSAGSHDIFVAKYNAGGAHQWSKRFGGTGTDQGYAIAADNSDNVIVTGRFQNMVFFGGDTLTAISDDIFVAKYNAGGGHQWSKRFGGTSNDFGHGVAVSGSGNLFVTGQFAGTIDFGGGNLVSGGDPDLFVAKFSPGGGHQWSKRFGDTGSEIGYGITVDGSGSVVVTGQFSDTADFGGGDLVSAGSSDLFVAKYSTGGGHQWSHRFGGTGTEIGYGVTASVSGDVSVTGHFSDTVDFGGGNLVSAGSVDIFVAKYDAGGVHQWSQRFGNTGADEGRAVAVDASGDVLITGTFSSAVDFGGGALSSAGLLDVFLAKYNPLNTTGTEEVIPTFHLLQNSPNPFRRATQIKYRLEEGGTVRLQVFDVEGRLVATAFDGVVDAGEYSFPWNAQDTQGRTLTPGVYFYRLETKQSSISRRLVILP